MDREHVLRAMAGDDDQLDRAFVQLTERQRTVLVLRYLLELSVAQAAEILEVPAVT